jgi:hypothetical protein
MAGYSGTPLPKKLGIKPGHRIKTMAAPSHYLDLLQPIPADVLISARLTGDVDMIHLFVLQQAGLADCLRASMQQIREAGAIWVSWPKKASGVTTDMTEDEVRRSALPLGLVDVKVCAVDEIWSGLKLVIRKENRQP